MMFYFFTYKDPSSFHIYIHLALVAEQVLWLQGLILNLLKVVKRFLLGRGLYCGEVYRQPQFTRHHQSKPSWSFHA